MSRLDSVHLIWLIGALILVGSGLAARRLPRGTWLRLAMLWIGIFATAWAVAAIAPTLLHF